MSSRAHACVNECTVLVVIEFETHAARFVGRPKQILKNTRSTSKVDSGASVSSCLYETVLVGGWDY